MANDTHPPPGFPALFPAPNARDRLHYELTMRQEPKQARMCGVGADRRPIDPPPIVQLRVHDPAAPREPRSPASSDSSASDSAYVSHTLDAAKPPPPSHAASFLQNPYYFMFASLAKPDEDTELHWLKDGKTRCTTGSVVSSLYCLKDLGAECSGVGWGVDWESLALCPESRTHRVLGIAPCGQGAGRVGLCAENRARRKLGRLRIRVSRLVGARCDDQGQRLGGLGATATLDIALILAPLLFPSPFPSSSPPSPTHAY
ncbi:hypothetical protein NEOLEDRAFT_1183051 [Neolentinus lepideus HHB14362 ss-1]|uniref:Velvet domain-containing protein n=1 Tax=Neolentinus lepideus HHB14362 ss-1 TaxID=1314782 RepID=A0A165NN43_9AGAM|nr:hypothetical protein NEOLEDRAFT_1183051 [Neolentinus lepideus HHB14362 ss-1]